MHLKVLFTEDTFILRGIEQQLHCPIHNVVINSRALNDTLVVGIAQDDLCVQRIDNLGVPNARWP